MPNKRTHLYGIENRSNRLHSIASLSWMESVPYWLKQHERFTSSLNTFSFFTNPRLFIYFSFIKASTLDSNIVSLLDFWLFFFFWTPSYRYVSLSFSLFLSFILSLTRYTHTHTHTQYTYTHTHAYTHTHTYRQTDRHSFPFFRSLLKNISWCTNAVFHALLDSNV